MGCATGVATKENDFLWMEVIDYRLCVHEVSQNENR